jgi:hypothetical protein
MFFSFPGAICSQAALDYVVGWGREHVVYGTHLLGSQVSFETGQQGEMAVGFSQGRGLLGLGSALLGIG